MDKKKFNQKVFFIYELILFVIYLAVTIFFYFYFDKSNGVTINLIAIGAVVNLVIFVLSLWPMTRSIPRQEREELDLNTAGVRMAQAIFTFFITVTNTIVTIFFAALVLATAIGRI